MSERQTQRAKILRLLVQARGQWVPLPAILELRISQYGARIHELRKMGFAIENRTERGTAASGQVHSWFRLVALPETKMEGKAAAPKSPESPQKLEPARGERRVTGLPLWDAGVRQ